MALILIPALIRAITVICCASFSTEGRPNRFTYEYLRLANKGQFDIWLRRDELECRVQERSAFMNRLFNIETILA